jgi:hypothetical protein
MFAYSVQHKLMGGYAVYAFLVILSVFAMRIAAELPGSPEKKE